jgi:class 3 adenylate cyclase
MTRRLASDEKVLSGMLAERARHAHDSSAESSRRLMALDQRIRRRFEKTVAVLVLDMSGFTRITLERGILHYLMMIHRMRELCGPCVRRCGGRVVKTEADNLFARFDGVREAVDASVAMLERLSEANVATDDESDIQISVGIGWGATLVLQRDMWGSEFNLASKLGEDLAGTGEVLLTAAAHRALGRSRYTFRRRPVTVSGMPYSSYLLRWHARAGRAR